MCGIAGVWRTPGPTDDDLTGLAITMAGTLTHRGPDDSGSWVDASCGIALGFRRLAIFDLSAHGHQPMGSQSGRYRLVFNGEVYNHPELRVELAGYGHEFRGHSDTEVILAAFEQWGIRAAVGRFVGMFAMAVWDRERRSLHLLRDRLGIKPLFVLRGDGFVAFASELKALSVLPDFAREIDSAALASYFRYLYIPAPGSIYRNVAKLLPGHVLEVRHPAGELTEPRPFWSLEQSATQGRELGFHGDDAEAVEALESTLADAVRIRMRADVPVGAFLSGGIDSSTVVALMQEVSRRPVRTFTIGFDVEEHDESSEAAAVAQHLGTDHRHIRLGGEDAIELVGALPSIFDEPLADPSQLPTYLICSAARQDVTVAISGDGGDELFAGYNRYVYGGRTIERASKLPPALRSLLARGLTSVSPGTWDRFSRRASLLGLPQHRLAGEKVHKLGRLLHQDTRPAMYRSLVSAWQNPPVSGFNGADPRAERAFSDGSLSMLERMMLADQSSYLPDDLLAKVDRTSMASALEVRVPILDHRVVELSWRLPEHLKLRDGRGKWVLRQVLERRVPRALIDRPKVGFSVPLAEWLRGPLRGWAEDHLDPRRLREVQGLDVGAIRSTWEGFQRRRNNEHLALWTVLIFEQWRRTWIP